MPPKMPGGGCLCFLGTIYLNQIENLLNTPNENTETPINSLPEVTFDQLPERLQTAATNANWTVLTPVQAKAIPYLFAKKDMMIQARTGSGKTGAFVLPMLELLNPRKETVQTLILVPTRELAKQVSEAADTLFAGSGLRTVAVYGGVGYGPQVDALKGGAHVVVGTPGRVLDHLLRRTLALDSLEMLIFDEADRMLSMGFFPDMLRIKRYLPNRRVRSCMFSATFPAQVMQTALHFMREPEYLTLSSDHVHVTDTDHLYVFVPGLDKDRALVRLIELENPASALIFCNTKAKVHYVTVVLQRFGYDADELSSDLSQAVRERVLNRVRRGELRFLVATDVAARGLDIPELSHVIQYEPPDELEAYIHRAGRTGRAGATGVAITLGSGTEKFALDRIGKRYDIGLEERPLPADEDVEAIVTQRLTALLEARLRDRDKLQTERSQRFIPLARELAENVGELPLITMLLDDYYQQTLHAPVVPPEAVHEPRPPRPPRTERPTRPPKRRRR